MNFLRTLSLGLVVFTGSLTGSINDKDPLIQDIHYRVLKTIEHSNALPGLSSDEFNYLKHGMKDRWNDLVENGVIEFPALDNEVRPFFTALQGIMEQILAAELNKSVSALNVVIHTPMPATPLCFPKDDSQKLARTTSLRNLLSQGGNLYMAYPKEGIFKRTEEQQAVYKQELATYPNLFDRPLDLLLIEDDLVGAIYVFKNNEGKEFAFAIKMSQALNPKYVAHFGLWFGEIDHPAIQERLSNLSEKVLKYASEPIPLTH